MVKGELLMTFVNELIDKTFVENPVMIFIINERT